MVPTEQFQKNLSKNCRREQSDSLSDTRIQNFEEAGSPSILQSSRLFETKMNQSCGSRHHRRKRSSHFDQLPGFSRILAQTHVLQQSKECAGLREVVSLIIRAFVDVDVIYESPLSDNYLGERNNASCQ